VLFLATVQSGFEKEAIEEIKEKVGGSVRTTYFKGLLLGKTDMKKEELIKFFKNTDTCYISKIIPVNGITPTNINDIKNFFEKYPTTKRFAVRCIRRGRHPFSSTDVEREVGKFVEKKGGRVDLENPEVIFLINIIQDYSCLSVLTPSEIVVKKPKVSRRWEKGKRPISRAELKMREIMKRFPDLFRENDIALDIGAAPGGWSRALAEKVKKVIAVDTAELDDSVKKIKNIVYVKKRAENLILDEKVDLLTNDVNLLHLESTKLSIDVAKKYLKKGGFLIQTVKLDRTSKNGASAAKSLNQALQEVTHELEKNQIKVLNIVKLKYNTKNEITVIAKKVS
jgi:tRNA acetyltransferase TAN1